MIGQTLSHYRITELLGKGGMGEVYRARDARLERDVAVKILLRGVAADVERRPRFEREARALAALQHPNIVQIFDFGVQDDVAYAVMELIEGRTLQEEIGSGKIPPDRAVSIAADVVRGLHAAHAKGILHRDLKPANVMLTADGQVKILDFGIAKRADPAASADATLTVAGGIVGTPAYLAPERITDQGADARSDLFAVGVILHEMLTGRNPFQRATPAETVSAILRDEPSDPAGAPDGLRSLLRSLLQKDPSLRPNTALDLTQRLRTCLEESAQGVIDSIAVLPLHNEAEDEDAEILIDGLTDSLIDTLSQLPRLKVLARSTVFQRRDLHDRPEEAGRELGVRAVLAGRLQRRGDLLVIRAELVDASDGSRLWGGRFRKPVGDLFEVEEAICQEITENLRFQLSPSEKERIARRGTENSEARESYMRGRFIWNRWKNADAMRSAIGFFERAIDLDPLYASAFAGLADSFSILGNVKAIPPGEAYPKAKNAVLQGLAINDQLAELHTSLGFIQRYWEWDWEGSRASFERAIELNPGYATAHRFYGHLLSGLGEHQAALERVHQAQALDPLSLILHTSVGDAYFYARRYDEAMEWYRKSIKMDPGFLPGHTDLARALELAGRYEEALEEFELAAALTSEGPADPSAGLACVFASMGKREDALKVERELIALSEKKYVSPYAIASIRSCLGDVDAALDWLEKALDEHDQTLVWAKTHPRLDAIRGTERYKNVLERMGL